MPVKLLTALNDCGPPVVQAAEVEMNALRTLLQLKATGGLVAGMFLAPVLAFWLARPLSLPEEEPLVRLERTASVVYLPPPPPMAAAEVQAPLSDESASGGAAAPAAAPVMAPAADPPGTEGTMVQARRPAGAAGTGAAVKASPPKSPRSSKRKCDPDDSRIRATGEAAWQVERALVQYYARHLGALNDLGYVVAHEDDQGRSEGLRVGGLRCNNVVQQAGIKNGDIVHSVNGRPVKSLAQAIWLYTTMKGKDEVVVEVLRKGVKREHRYQLVDAPAAGKVKG